MRVRRFDAVRRPPLLRDVLLTVARTVVFLREAPPVRLTDAVARLVVRRAVVRGREVVFRRDVVPLPAVVLRREVVPRRAVVLRREPVPLRELVRPREDLPRELELDELRPDVERPELRRVRPPLRSDAGISACATALVSCGISFSRKPDMRSS